MYVAILSRYVPMPDIYRATHAVSTVDECPGKGTYPVQQRHSPLANVLTSDDRKALRRSASEYISFLLCRNISTILAMARTYMSRVTTDHICVATRSTAPTVLYAAFEIAMGSREWVVSGLNAMVA